MEQPNVHAVHNIQLARLVLFLILFYTDHVQNVFIHKVIIFYINGDLFIFNIHLRSMPMV